MSRHPEGPTVIWGQTPRPADDGERPFTDFGQFGPGHLDTRVFGQDVYWVDITGTPHFLVDMSQAHRANVVDFLRREATGWWTHEVTYPALGAATLVLTGADEPTTRQALARLDLLLRLGAEEWMETSPLMRRLRHLQTTGQADT